MKRTSEIVASVALGVWLSVLTPGVARAAVIDITVANDTGREITGLYVSATAQSKWSPDQLNGAVVAPGGAFTLQSVSCGQATISRSSPVRWS